MAARLVYLMDPMCSWCWGFAPVLAALAERAQAAGVPVHLVVGGLRRETQRLDASGRARILGYWRAVEEATGQPFDLERGLPAGLIYDTEPACRALVVARALGSPLALAQRLQRAFYCEGLDVTRPEVLQALAAESGLAAADFLEAFHAEPARRDTEADFAWAQRLGIAGFPTLLAERDGQLALLTNGYRPLAALLPLLDRWLDRGTHG